jgi:hypothetical protein
MSLADVQALVTRIRNLRPKWTVTLEEAYSTWADTRTFMFYRGNAEGTVPEGFRIKLSSTGSGQCLGVVVYEDQTELVSVSEDAGDNDRFFCLNDLFAGIFGPAHSK